MFSLASAPTAGHSLKGICNFIMCAISPTQQYLLSRQWFFYYCCYSWLCLRSQFQDDASTGVNVGTTVAMPHVDTNLTWCNGADDWDENDNGDSANGNVMNVDNAQSPINVLQRYAEDFI